MDAGGLGHELVDAREGDHDLVDGSLKGDIGLYVGMYDGASLLGGGISGAVSIIEGALECPGCGREVVDGWYDRETGVSL